MIARCKCCNKEIVGGARMQSCGCPNMMAVSENTITANDLNKVILIKSKNIIKNDGFLTESDLKYQEERRKRKVRKLDFEER